MTGRQFPALLSVLGIGLAASACCCCSNANGGDYVTKAEMNKVWMDGYTAIEGGQTIHYPGLRPYLLHLSDAVCQIEARGTFATPLTEAKKQCPGGGGGTPPPKYPPG